jgi:hypothetical protein
MLAVPLFATTNYCILGMYFRENSGKGYPFVVLSEGGTYHMSCGKDNSPTSENAGVDVTWVTSGTPPLLYMRISEDATNINFYTSNDGLHWLLFFQEARLTWLTNGATSVGAAINPRNATYPIGLHVLSFAVA